MSEAGSTSAWWPSTPPPPPPPAPPCSWITPNSRSRFSSLSALESAKPLPRVEVVNAWQRGAPAARSGAARAGGRSLPWLRRRPRQHQAPPPAHMALSSLLREMGAQATAYTTAGRGDGGDRRVRQGRRAGLLGRHRRKWGGHRQALPLHPTRFDSLGPSTGPRPASSAAGRQRALGEHEFAGWPALVPGEPAAAGRRRAPRPASHAPMPSMHGSVYHAGWSCGSCAAASLGC